MTGIDLNSDLGESFGAWKMGDDAAMLDIVSSANIACGFHAGDPAGILDTLKAAQARGVAVGAHVAYRDLAGFGRRNMEVASRDLVADVIYQIGALQALAAAAGTQVTYVKPHGALYNTIAFNRHQADAVIAAVKRIGANLKLVVLAGSPLAQWAQEAGLNVIQEAFADRAYLPDARLAPRSQAGSVLRDPQAVARRMLQLVQEGLVRAIDGSLARIDAQSICVHGDSAGAVEIAGAVKNILVANGILITPFSPQPANLPRVVNNERNEPCPENT